MRGGRVVFRPGTYCRRIPERNRGLFWMCQSSVRLAERLERTDATRMAEPPSAALPGLAPPTPTAGTSLQSSDEVLQPDDLSPPSRENSMDSSGSSPPPDSPHRADLRVPTGVELEARDSFDEKNGGGGGGGGGPAPKFMRDVETASIAWPPPRDTTTELQQATRAGARISTDPTHRYTPHAGNVRRTFSETVHDSLPHMPRVPRMSSGTRERYAARGARRALRIRTAAPWCRQGIILPLASRPRQRTDGHTIPTRPSPGSCTGAAPRWHAMAPAALAARYRSNCTAPSRTRGRVGSTASVMTSFTQWS